MVETEVSSLKLVGEDMVGEKETAQEAELEESNVECMVAYSEILSALVRGIVRQGYFSGLIWFSSYGRLWLSPI